MPRSPHGHPKATLASRDSPECAQFPPYSSEAEGDVPESSRREKTRSPFPGLENGRINDAKMAAKMVPKWMQNGAMMASNACRRHSGHGLCAKRLTLTKHQYLLCFVNIFMFLWRSIAAHLVHTMQKSWLEQCLGKTP